MPLFASSKRPMRRSEALVKAPFTCPKSSLSTRPDGMAPQFTLIRGLPLRALRL